MSLVIKSPEAAEDLHQIWLFIAMDNIDAADRLIDAIDDQLKGTAEMPLSGRARDELRPGLRSVPVGNSLLVYRPIENGIELVRVIHGARDIERLFE
ncbi:MAG: type II toxin-antitoxin system RelE/ParE family toxin [Pirellulaceae bacterium]|nr:type II toxin-antitoxin system RelE/ParE family toxin [Pirellulaceae bacterium]